MTAAGDPAARLAVDVRSAERSPDDDRPDRIVFVHGFTQTHRSWDDARDALADRYETIAVDAPGHGESSDLRLTMADAASTLGDVGGPATYVGYSMGARLALHLAVARPEVVNRLVLVSGTAGIADDAERAARMRADEALAQEIERDGVERFLERWLALPLFAGLTRQAAGIDDRLTNTAAGLASSLRLAGTGAQKSLWDRVGGLSMPVLLIVGAADEKFVAIGQRLHAAIPDCQLAVVAGAGHTVHLEQPERFVHVLRTWLGAGANG